MSRPSWHRQAGLEADVNAVRPDEVRVDMMLGIALAVPGHHIPPIMSLGGLAARRTSSSAHRSPTSYKGAQLDAGLHSVDWGATRRTGLHGLAKPRHHAIRHQRQGGRGLNQALTVPWSSDRRDCGLSSLKRYNLRRCASPRRAAYQLLPARAPLLYPYLQRYSVYPPKLLECRKYLYS